MLFIILLFVIIVLAFMIGVIVLYVKGIKFKLNRIKEVRQKEADIAAIRKKLDKLERE